MIQQESLPVENLERAKHHKHTYKISSEAFSLDQREFVLHNLSLKKDYSDEYDYLNFRRGLTYIEEIIDFKHSEPSVARKGLRKFRDLMAEYLDIKQSHVNSSKYHYSEKNRLFKNIQNSSCDSFLIYNTEKVNGENAQISVVYDKYWLIGSKNKCLLAINEEDLDKMKNKHQYKQNKMIAKAWFGILKNKSEEEISKIKEELSNKTLVGEYCNMGNLQHLVNYGSEAQLFFYALVEKNSLVQDCLPFATTFQFLEKYELPRVKYEVVEAKTIEHTYEKLRDIVVKMNEMTMKEGGEGSVLYIQGVNSIENEQDKHSNLLICKVKTIQYRIFRKLREKLKIYLQKYNKNYDNLLKKFTKQISEIARDFKLCRPFNDYVEIAKKAFVICEEQSRPISRFVGNRYIDFLKLVQKNVTKEKFMEIVKGEDIQLEDEEEEENKEEVAEDNIEPKEELSQNIESKEKHVIALIPLTIPSSGKTTLVNVMKDFEPNFRLWSLSSDEIKRQLMDELMKKMKNVTRKQAFEKVGDRSNKIFYNRLGQIFKEISESKQQNHLLFIDKNHPQSAVKPGIKNLDEKSALYKNIKLVKIALMPISTNRMIEKGVYSYPFSANYVLTCLKRVLMRPEHLTLEGSEQERCNIVFGFANLFRNFSISPYNLRKYFNSKIQFTLANEQCISFQDNLELYSCFMQILKAGQPGKFGNPHRRLQQFIGRLQKTQLAESKIEQGAKQALSKLRQMFDNFENIEFTKDEE